MSHALVDQTTMTLTDAPQVPLLVSKGQIIALTLLSSCNKPLEDLLESLGILSARELVLPTDREVRHPADGLHARLAQLFLHLRNRFDTLKDNLMSVFM